MPPALSRLGIGARMGLGFASIIALLLLLAGLGVDRMAAVISNTELILHDRFEKVTLAHAIQNEVNRQARAVRTALITTDVAVIKAEMEKIEEAERLVDGAVGRLKGMSHPPRGQQALESLLRTRKGYDGHKVKLMQLVAAQSLDEGGSYLIEHMLPAQNAYLAAIENFAYLQSEAMTQFGGEATQVARGARTVTIGLAAGAVVLALAIAFFMTRSITLPIAQAVQVAETVAQGNLTSRIAVAARRTDETGQLLSALHRMNEGLIAIVGQVRDSSDSIATGASQIAAGNADLSHRTEAQAAQLQQTAATMEQVTAASQHNAENARTAALLANEARAAAVRGGEATRRMVATMGDIASGARKIGEITSAIDGIARQTNILALNAAVEGARAAHGGGGFVVVAGEVRSLAYRAAQAAKEIEVQIGASVQKIEAGRRLADEASGVMTDIVHRVDQVTQLICEIDAASGEQHQGIGHVSEAVQEIDRVTQQNVALVEECAAAAENLHVQSGRLADVVSAFTLEMNGVQPSALRS